MLDFANFDIILNANLDLNISGVFKFGSGSAIL